MPTPQQYLAIVADELGGPSNYRLSPYMRMPLADDAVRIAVDVAAVSYVDLLIASGGHQIRPPTPYIPGSEAAGRVIEVGCAVKGLKCGDLVVVTNYGGILSQEISIVGDQVNLLPSGWSMSAGAALPVSYTTAWHALVDRGALVPNDTVLVLGAGGAIGMAAIQVARHVGARVIACASSEGKRSAALEQGACAVISSNAEGWRERLFDVTGGKPIDVVFDPVGGSLSERAFRAISWRGRHLIVGFPAGIASIRTNLPLLKGASLIGVDVRQFSEREPALAKANLDKVLELATMGVFRPYVGRIYTRGHFQEAMIDVIEGITIGRVVINMQRE